MADHRLTQIANHLSPPSPSLSPSSPVLTNTYPTGLLSGKVAIVTGSGQGIGAETAKLFAREGAWVVVADIDEGKSAQVTQEIVSNGGHAISVPGNILDAQYLKQLVQRASEFGNGKFHILVNNAGFTWDGVVHKMADEQFETIWKVHVEAVFRLIREVAPWFRRKDGEERCIVNVGSASGVFGNAGQVNYAAAKAGVEGLTRTIAKEWGPQFGVRVNCVAFGTILTRLTAPKTPSNTLTHTDPVTNVTKTIPLGIPTNSASQDPEKRFANVALRRAGTPEEAAKAILALASPLMSFVSGITLEVTGGRLG